MTKKSELTSADDGDFYYADLIGMEVYFEDETLERVMEGLNEFALKYVETNDCVFLINDIFVVMKPDSVNLTELESRLTRICLRRF